MELIVYETDHYKVVVGEARLTEGFVYPLYKVVNKAYEVTEIETTVLPKALFECDDLTGALNQHLELQQKAAGASH